MKKGVARTSFSWTPKRELFCTELLRDMNQTKAAERAGFSKRSAKHIASEMMQLPEIQARVQSLMDKRAARVEAAGDKTLAEIARLAHADILGLYDERGCLKRVADIPEDLRRTIAAIEVDELWEGKGAERVLVGYTKKVKFWSKPDALTLEGKHLKLFTEVVQHEGLDKLADALAAARVRAKSR